MNKNSTPNRFYELIRKGKELPDVASISWLCEGDDKFNPERCAVILESSTGEQWELVIHPEPSLEFLNNEDEVILNTVLSYHHIDLEGLWCGWNADIPQVVNAMRKKYPYKLTFEVKKGKLNNFPAYRF